MKKYILIKNLSLAAAGIMIGNFSVAYSPWLLLMTIPVIGLIYSFHKIYERDT